MQLSDLRSFRITLAGVALFTLSWVTNSPGLAQEPPPPTQPTPDLELENRIEKLDQKINENLDAGRITDAVVTAQDLFELLRETRGKDHWETVSAQWNLKTYQRLVDQPREVRDRYVKARESNNKAEEHYARGEYVEAATLLEGASSAYQDILGEGHPDTASSYDNLAGILREQGKYIEAEAMFRRSLAITLDALGKTHPDTASSYNNLALVLDAQGKSAEAEPMFRQAVAICIELVGETHSYTATCFNNLALSLEAQGRSPEAETIHRHALAIRLELGGEADPETAISYGNLAMSLNSQGKYAEAELMHRRALAIRLAVVGETHPDTAGSYNNLALILDAQGKSAEAEAMHRRALAICLETLGETHPNTAVCYNNLALCLNVQGSYAEAEAIHRRALGIRLERGGESLSETAISFGNLASSLNAQGDYAEAEAMHRRALAIRLNVLGEIHPDTAGNLHQLAEALVAQGKYAEAEQMLRRALAICLKTRGENHPDTAIISTSLAKNLDVHGKPEEALKAWIAAAESYQRSREHGTKGFEAALTVGGSPLPPFALALARAGQLRDAWARWEQGLARGLFEEITGRAVRPLMVEEQDREASLLGQSQAIEERISKLLDIRARTDEQDKGLEDLRRQRSEIRRQTLELERQFESQYGALAGQPAAIEAVQKALPTGTALVGWVDVAVDNPDGSTYHGACLLRPTGDPVWVFIKGPGKDGAWSKEEESLAGRLQTELSPQTTTGKAGPLAEAMARQRLGPLKEHLEGIERLVVVNSPGLSGVPIEVLMAATPDPAWDRITVSYAPSASMFVYLKGLPKFGEAAPTLLALADPAYPEIQDQAPAPEPPALGLAIARVVPNSNADLNGIEAGDVLLTYDGTTLAKGDDLPTVADGAGPRKVPLTYWREGVTREIEVAVGPLGVGLDPRPVDVAVRARQAAGEILLGMRGESRDRLPGTRREVEAVAKLFPPEHVSMILGEQACESTVQGMARSGALKGFRYLHFATHGESDPRFAYRSSLILAPDPERSDDPFAFDTDGTITAEQIARTWELDADLVVLSACQTGLGRVAGGEGYLGFAQPLFARGARSLVLSLWSVDDNATALLMTRFYQNLLGKREGLAAPLPKAEALAEAKRWLRNLGPGAVDQELKKLPRGEIVRREAVEAPADTDRPYDDPKFWAGFILVGDPD